MRKYFLYGFFIFIGHMWGVASAPAIVEGNPTDSIEKRMTAIERKFDSLHQRFQQGNYRFDVIQADIREIQTMSDEGKTKIEDLSIKVSNNASSSEAINRRVRALEEEMTAVFEEFMWKHKVCNRGK